MLAEKTYLAGIEILSLNTDGILCRPKYSQKDEYDRICKEWEEITGFILEDTLYSKFVQTSVNDYIAQTTDGKLKFKGDFEIDKEIHKNKSNRIIRIALKNFFIDGIPIEETIKNHKNIFDFCIGVRAKGNTYFEERKVVNGKIEKKILSKTLRYYISNRGSVIYKIYEDGRSQMLNVFKQSGRTWYQTVFNKYVNKDNYDINYNFYIYETRKIITQIEYNQYKIEEDDGT